MSKPTLPKTKAKAEPIAQVPDVQPFTKAVQAKGRKPRAAKATETAPEPMPEPAPEPESEPEPSQAPEPTLAQTQVTFPP